MIIDANQSFPSDTFLACPDFRKLRVFFIPVFDKPLLVVFYFGTQMESKVKRKPVANFTAFSAAICVRPCETMCFPYDAFRRANDFKPPS